MTENIPPLAPNQPGRIRRALGRVGDGAIETAGAVTQDPVMHDAVRTIGGNALHSTGITNENGRMSARGTASVARGLVTRPKETIAQLGVEVAPHIAELAWTAGRLAVGHAVASFRGRNNAPSPGMAELSVQQQPIAGVVALPPSQLPQANRHLPNVA